MNLKRQAQQNSQPRCHYCGSPARIVWVHGHGQCARCGINVQECCSGEQCVTANARSKRSARYIQ